MNNNDFNLVDKEKTIGAELQCYAGGGGGLSFTYCRNGISTGQKVTLRDVKWFIKNRRPDLGEFLVARNGGSENGDFILFRPCKRLSTDEISFNGNSYRYERLGQLLAVYNDENAEIRNESVKAAIRFYLDNESYLDSIIYKGGL